MTPLLVSGCVVLAYAALAAEVVSVPNINITFADPPVPPPHSLPKEALYPPGFDSNEHGPFTNIVAGRIAALTVTWRDPQRFKTERQAQGLLRELLSSTNTQTWAFHAWSFVDVEPDLVAKVQHTDGKEGKWVVWCPPPYLYWAYEDGNGKWWWGAWEVLKAPYPKSLETQKK